MTLARLEAALKAQALLDMGRLDHADGTLVLLGPAPDFWTYFQRSPEAQDAGPDPIDRWSKRVISTMANELGAEAFFPFGGPPYAPFLSWATASGRAWSSPVGMLVHDEAGLMISYRGALLFRERTELSPKHPTPCQDCAAEPCVSACPVGALARDQSYNVEACKAYLRSPEGKDCLTKGCLVRRACPVSMSFDRDAAQSGYHMKVFLG